MNTGSSGCSHTLLTATKHAIVATSALDANTAAAIHRSPEKQMRERTSMELSAHYCKFI